MGLAVFDDIDEDMAGNHAQQSLGSGVVLIGKDGNKSQQIQQPCSRMGKAQIKAKAVANKDLYSRLNLLHQAADLLSDSAPGLTRRYVSDMNVICRKSQLRM